MVAKTQEECNEVFYKEIKPAWDKLVAESGKSEQMFALTSKEAAHFIGMYEFVKEALVEEHGFTLPPLFEGLEVKIGE
jgi:hypothetical protein